LESGTWLALLTAVLVLVTLYYAVQTRQMAGEMRAARRLSVQPKLSIIIHMLARTYGVPRLVNVGQGPALDVNVTLQFPRRDESGWEERKWQAAVMPPGEIHDFFPPGRTEDINSMEDFARAFREIVVTGTMRSSLEEDVAVNETSGDLQEWFEMSAAVQHLWEEEPTRMIAKELANIEQALSKLRGVPGA